MTAAYDAQPGSAHPLLPGALPHNIRTALPPEARDEFDATYREGTG